MIVKTPARDNNAPQLNVKQPHLAHLEVLSPSGSSVEGATRLFELMRALDASPAPWLVAELPPPEGLGAAIRDRLKRAASGFFDPSAPPHQA